MTTESAQVFTREELMAVDETSVLAICGLQVFREAEAILARGIGSANRDGLEIRGSVTGERGKPQSVRIAFEFTGLKVRCDCWSRDRFCAHVAALMLLWARRPGDFGEEEATPARFSLHRNWVRPKERAQSPQPRDARSELRSLLSSMLVADLRNLGRRLEVRLRGSAKSDLIEQLVATLSDPSHIERALASLGADLRLALTALYALGADEGPDNRHLKVALSRLAVTGSGGDSLFGELHARGLIFTGGGLAEPAYLQVPSAYWPYLPAIDSVERVPTPDQSTQPAGSLVDSLLAVWSSVRDRQLTLLARPVTLPSLLARAYPQLQDPGYIHEEVEKIVRSEKWGSEVHELTVPRRTPLLDDASLRDLSARVGGAEAALFAWHLLEALGLVVPGEAVSVSEEPARELLWRGPLGRVSAALDAWLRLAGWSELDLALAASPRLRLRRRLRVQNSTTYFADWASLGDIDEALGVARRFLVRAISLLPDGVWLNTSSLLDTIWRMWPDFLYGEPSRQPTPAWWLEEDGHRVDSASFPDWARGPGAVVVALISGPLHWLGLADLAGPPDNPTAFRLRPEARLLRGAAVSEEAALAPIELGPDFDVQVATGYPDAELRDLLSTAGKLLEVSASSFRYRLAPEGMRTLFESGSSAEDMLGLLESRARSVPAELRSTIERWWRLYGQLRLYEGLTLIELSDDQVLDELLVATSLRRHLVHRFTPRLLAVDPAGADELFAELRGRGYMPLRVSQGEGERASGDSPAGAGER